MLSPLWRKAINAAADSRRAKQFYEQLSGTPAAAELKRASPEQARVWSALFAGSPVMSALLVQHPEWLSSSLQAEHLRHPRQEQGLRREVDGWLRRALAVRDHAGALAQLRQFKQREMLRIAARDLAWPGDAPQITREISNVADVCLEALLQICRQQLTERFGAPYHLDANERWHPTSFVVLGLGKLGGQELNYSSDIDVVFLYNEEGFVFKQPPRDKKSAQQGLTNHQFFKRLAEAFIAEVSRPTSDGALFRIDLRLRPEGDAGPLVRSMAGYENFYAQWGQTWERMMLLKARCVAGDPSLAGEFLEMIQPFRYPRSIGEGVLREIAAMKTRLENEVVRPGELDRNVKLGRGGIREIEFIAQTSQLLHAGHAPFLQGAQTLPTLEKLARYGRLAAGDARDLAAAYTFLRDVEHRLQMEDNLQTHTLPADAASRARMAALMGFAEPAEFEAALKRHTRRVREIYDRFLKTDETETPSPFPQQLRGAEAEWKTILTEHSFKDAEKSFRLLNEFAQGPGYVHVSQRTTDFAMELIPKMLALCPRTAQFKSEIADLKSPPLSDPDRVLARLDSFITAYGARATLFETWSRHPSLFQLLLQLFDRSEFLAELAIRTPDLVDELEQSGRLRRAKSAEETLRDLRHGLADADQRLWLRRYHQAEFMRIGLRDILGLADLEQNVLELSNLADACLQYALETVQRRHRLRTAALAIVGLGKLGGRELTYGSDLDLLFVAGSKAKNLAKLQRVAAEVMEMLSGTTELGVAFVTDARLRPDGDKGLLVNTLEAYEDYYRHRARLWEIQALTRVRPLAGEVKLGQRFQALTALLTNFKDPSLPLACYTPHWKKEIARMRLRIEKERTPPGQDALAIKTGAGGLIDAEFIAQAFCLEKGWNEANTLRALHRARDAGALESDADKLIENYRQLRRIEGILRRWSFEGETVLPVDAAPYYRVSLRCGFATPKAFRDALAGYRRAIREVYERVFGG